MNVSTRETELFARVLATFRGERVPLDDQGAKGLWFALDQPASDLVVTPDRGVRVVDGLLTGLHEPEASHLLMLEAVAGRAAIDRAYEAAIGARYLWHEFGDVHLILP